jgi:hypothetical protein
MHINTVNDKHTVEFDQGKFDRWCVYLTRNGQARYAPLDDEYFSFFKSMASRHGSKKVYDDFVKVYEVTTPSLSATAIKLIKDISASYNNDREEVEIWFSVIYGGMIAEENKAGMILKKRIKRLGMHQVLIENYEPKVAAKFSYGKKWRDLNGLMKERGFGI